MKIHSNYYITDKSNPEKIVIVTDENPTGVTILIKNTSDKGGQESFALPRMQMIEALEYVLSKLKAGL